MISSALDVTEIIFGVLYLSIVGLIRCYKTKLFLHLYVTLTSSDVLILKQNIIK